MRSWELTSMVRHARALMEFTPNAQLARALINFMFAARCELQRRGYSNDEYLNSALLDRRTLSRDLIGARLKTACHPCSALPSWALAF